MKYYSHLRFFVYIYIYIYMYVCILIPIMYVCMYVLKDKKIFHKIKNK